MCGGGRKALFQGRRDIDHGRSEGFGGGGDSFALALGVNERLEPYFKIVVVLCGSICDSVSTPLQGLRMESGWTSLTQAVGLGFARSPLRG